MGSICVLSLIEVALGGEGGGAGLGRGPGITVLAEEEGAGGAGRGLGPKGVGCSSGRRGGHEAGWFVHR